MLLRVIHLLAASLVVLCACAQESAVHLDPFMGRGLALHAQVNGQDGYFLFDTGGGVTNVTPAFAARIGCKPWGQMSGFTMMAHRIDMQRCDTVRVRVADKEFARETIGVFDGSGMMPPGAPHLDGTIALDVFEGGALKISVADRTLSLLDARSLKRVTAGRTAMPLHVVRDAEGMALSVNVPVRTPEGLAWFELDSGNTSPIVLVGKHLAPGLKLDASEEANKHNQQATLTLADGTQWSGDMRVFDLVLDGNLGATFLQRNDVVLDLGGGKRVWIVPRRP